MELYKIHGLTFRLSKLLKEVTTDGYENHLTNLQFDLNELFTKFATYRKLKDDNIIVTLLGYPKFDANNYKEYVDSFTKVILAASLTDGLNTSYLLKPIFIQASVELYTKMDELLKTYNF